MLCAHPDAPQPDQRSQRSRHAVSGVRVQLRHEPVADLLERAALRRACGAGFGDLAQYIGQGAHEGIELLLAFARERQAGDACRVQVEEQVRVGPALPHRIEVAHRVRDV